MTLAVVTDTIAANPNTAKPNKPYNLVRSEILSVRKEIIDLDVSIDSVGGVFEELLVDHIFPYWYGTPWDFEGHTNEPNQGEIACGYFVTTTLKHMGFNLNRYRLAQQYSLNEVKILSCGEEILDFNTSEIDEVVNDMKNDLEEGIYVIGLSSHVGFMLKRDGELFFIHSNYYDPVAVVIEDASTSEALLSSSLFYLTAISGNSSLMKKWLSSEEIKVQ